MKNETFIYTLSDSNGNIRYIGKTDKPEYRLNKHLKESKHQRTHKEKWINLVLSSGDNIFLEIIDIVDIKDWSFWEMYWISQMKAWGFNLVNGTSGGEGSDGFRNKKHNNATKLKCKISALSKTKHHKLFGENNGNTKLTNNDILEIKKMCDNGILRQIIADKYNIHKKYIPAL